MKKNTGITIISLVVTIIILIILAGISINLTLGQNGIITKAKQAKENIELAKVEEETRLNELYMQMESEGVSTGDISYDAIAKLVEFKREIASAISDMGITTAENADATTMATNIRNISGASSADKVSYDNTNSGLEATNVQSAIDEINNSIQQISKNSVDDSITMISTISIGSNNYVPMVRIRILLKQNTVIDVTATGSYQTSSSEVTKTYTDTDNNLKIKVRFTAVYGGGTSYAYISINDGSEQKFDLGTFSIAMAPSTKNFAGYIIKVDNKYSTSLTEIL